MSRSYEKLTFRKLHSDDDSKSRNNRRHTEYSCPCYRNKPKEHTCTCKHRLIFDKRFIIDEQFLHYNRFDCVDHHPCSRRSLCDGRFHIRLAGLDRGLAFKLRQLLDCESKFDVDCEGKNERIWAKICFIGTDFIEVSVTRRENIERKTPAKTESESNKENSLKLEEVRILPFDSIKSISIVTGNS